MFFSWYVIIIAHEHLLHVSASKNFRLHFRAAWVRDGQGLIDMSFQSTVYASDEVYVRTAGGISICCKLAETIQLGNHSRMAVFSQLTLPFAHTSFPLSLLYTQTQESWQQDPFPFNPLNLTNITYNQYYYYCFKS